jgi:hypothetical protein
MRSGKKNFCTKFSVVANFLGQEIHQGYIEGRVDKIGTRQRAVCLRDITDLILIYGVFEG